MSQPFNPSSRSSIARLYASCPVEDAADQKRSFLVTCRSSFSFGNRTVRMASYWAGSRKK